MDAPSTAPARVNSSTDLADQPVPVSPTSTDGWGEIENGIHEEIDSEKDGWDDIEPLEEPKASQALANIQAAQKQPVSQPKPEGNATILIIMVIDEYAQVSRVNVLVIWGNFDELEAAASDLFRQFSFIKCWS